MNNKSETKEIVPGLILGGLSALETILEQKPDVLFPLDRLPGWIWETGFRGEIVYYPITDYDILPDDVLEKLAGEIARRIREGKRAAVFCTGGHGRTGYAAACVLHLLGIRNPVAYLRRNYSPSAVETEEQEEAVERFCRNHPSESPSRPDAEMNGSQSKMSAEKLKELTKEWFGGIRSAAEDGIRLLEKDYSLDSLQKAKMRILFRQNCMELISFSIASAENLDPASVSRITGDLYSTLMEDAIAGVWSSNENLELARFLAVCSEGMEETADFCDLYDRAMGNADRISHSDPDSPAVRARKQADKSLDRFIEDRKKQNREDSSEDDDSPPPWLDEFEYIDWIMTH